MKILSSVTRSSWKKGLDRIVSHLFSVGMKFHRYLPIVEGFLALCGLHIRQYHRKTPLRAKVFISVNACLLTFLFLSILIDNKSVPELVYNVTVSGIYYLPLSFFERLVRKQKTTFHFIKDVEELLDKWALRDKKSRLKRAIRFVRTVSFVSFWSSYGLILAVVSVPLVQRYSQSDSTYLPHTLWPPICDLVKPECYFPIYAVEFTNMFIILSGVYATLTSIHIGVLYYVCTLFRVLNDNLRALKPCVNLRNDMVEITKDHLQLLRLVKTYNYLFSTNTFERQLWSMVFLSFAGFQIILYPAQSLSAIGLFVFTCLSMLALAWSGEQLKEVGEGFREAAWFLDWEMMPISAWKHLQFILLRTQKPLGWRAGSFGFVAYSWFLTIMKSSYSYLQALNRFERNKQ